MHADMMARWKEILPANAKLWVASVHDHEEDFVSVRLYRHSSVCACARCVCVCVWACAHCVFVCSWCTLAAMRRCVTFLRATSDPNVHVIYQVRTCLTLLSSQVNCLRKAAEDAGFATGYLPIESLGWNGA